MAKVTFNEYELRLLRFFAECYDDGAKDVCFGNIPGYSSGDYDKLTTAISRFSNYGIAELSSSDSVEILPMAVEYVHELDNPPPKDHLKDLETWARSKPIVVGLIVLLVIGPPVLKGWLDIVDWFVGLFSRTSQ